MHIICISQAYLRHILGIYQVYLRNIYLRHIAGIYLAFIREISGIYHIRHYLSNISGTYQVNLRLIKGLSQAYLRYLSDLSQSYLNHKSEVCLVTNAMILVNFKSFNILLLFLDTEIFASYAGSCFLVSLAPTPTWQPRFNLASIASLGQSYYCI